jgi:chromosome segregation ATPase
MKKVLLLFAILLSFTLISKASAQPQVDSAKDAARASKKIKGLQEDLADYKADLTKTLNRIPADSVAFVNATTKSNDALSDSKKAAANAVGGDLGDAKKAEKKAKAAANASDDAHDAKKQLDSDRKYVKKYLKKIEKTQKKIDKLQAGG